MTELGCVRGPLDTGGGKGMRIVHSEDKLEENIKIAQTEAKKFFNNDEVFIEKFFENTIHI